MWTSVIYSVAKFGVCGYLQSHAIDDELHGEVLSVGRDTVPDGRTSSVVLAELVDQVPQDCSSCVSEVLLDFIRSGKILPS